MAKAQNGSTFKVGDTVQVSIGDVWVTGLVTELNEDDDIVTIAEAGSDQVCIDLSI